MNLVRFHFSILPCTYLEEPFQHVHLLPTLRETTLQSDRQQTCPELGITFPCAALRYSHAKLSGSRQAERMDSNHQGLVYNQAVPSYLHIPNNPGSRVSKVFNVSCLPRVVSDIYFFFLKRKVWITKTLIKEVSHLACQMANTHDRIRTCSTFR